MIALEDLRRYAVGRSLFPPTTLKDALESMSFVQADPIRAPARAQDLMLRHRVKEYRAGDLERQYEALGIEEDFFINYGYVTRTLQASMHPRPRTATGWTAAHRKKARMLLEFVIERGSVHPREVDDHFSHGTVTNYWGGSSNATTHLLGEMHYHGMLRVARRDAGIRVYAPHEHESSPVNAKERRRGIDRLVDVVVGIYAPLPGATLSMLVRRLRYAAPQLRGEIPSALKRARERLAHARIEGIDWYWPAEEDPANCATEDRVWLLAPFDPVVWDRDRFELLWGWKYRFEAYTPVPKRKLGYYALPLLWKDRVIGWANVSAENGKLKAELGYAETPRGRVFNRELAAELDRMRAFLDL